MKSHKRKMKSRLKNMKSHKSTKNTKMHLLWPKRMNLAKKWRMSRAKLVTSNRRPVSTQISLWKRLNPTSGSCPKLPKCHYRNLLSNFSMNANAAFWTASEVNLSLTPNSEQNILNFSLSNCFPLSIIKVWGMPNLQMNSFQKKYYIRASVIVGTASTSTHFVKWSMATIKNFFGDVETGNGPKISIP